MAASSKYDMLNDPIFQEARGTIAQEKIDAIRDQFTNPKVQTLLDGARAKEDIIVSKKGVGDIWETKQGIKGSGLKWLITQTLLGDPVDSYTPKQFFNKRYADKSLYKDFNGCKTEVEVLEKFVEVVKRLVPQNVSYTSFNGQLMELNRKELFEMYFTLCKMRDGWCHTLEELFSFYNLDVNSLIYVGEDEIC